MKNSYLLVILFLFFFINMQGQNSRNIKLLNRDSFESIIDGKKVSLYTLKNNKGTITEITNYGGRVVSLWVKDKNGIYEDIVLGFSNIQG